MPFLHDISADDELLARPIRGTFALVRDNLERVMLVNIAWSLQVFPALAALAFPQLPLALRLFFFFYSLTALAPATALLYVWMGRVAQGEMLRLEMVKEDIHELRFAGLFRLVPLFGVLGFNYVALVLLGFSHVLLLDTLARFLFLILLTCSLYWGPLFALAPERSALSLLRQSLILIWKYPAPALLTGLIVLGVTALGIFTVVPLFVIIPAVIALLQTRRCQALLAREQGRQVLRAGVV